jgi:hypothetical protein
MSPRRAVLALLLVACGSPGGAEPPDAAPAPDAADPTVDETRSLTIGPVTVPAGGEDTICVVLDLGNEAPAMLRSIRTELTAGTHHVIVTRSTAAPSPTPVSCGAFAGGSPDSEVLFIAQQSEASLAYPAGAGLPLTAHQSIHLEMHYFNAEASGSLDIAGTVHLDLAEDTGGLRPVELLFTGGLSLSIPAGEMTTATSFHPLEPGIELFATTAHTHQWGRLATVELATSADDPDATVLHTSTDWAERQVDSFDPITITAGQGLRLTCNYHNESGEDVGFGLGAEDEMCFLWAHLVAAEAQ